MAFHKLERLSQATKLNHFALKAKLYLKAQQSAWGELERLRMVGKIAGKNAPKLAIGSGGLCVR